MIGKKFNIADTPWGQKYNVTEIVIIGENETQWIVDAQLTEIGNVIGKGRFEVQFELGKIFEIK